MQFRVFSFNMHKHDKQEEFKGRKGHCDLCQQQKEDHPDGHYFENFKIVQIFATFDAARWC